MHIDRFDLNLLRLFDAVFRARSVSRAAEELDITQPAASHGLTRLRLAIGDPLFTRAPGGVRPTPKAEQLAGAVSAALGLIEQTLGESERFDPAHAENVFRFHMSDIGEARFLPALLARLKLVAAGVRIECHVLAQADITAALDKGRIDFAIGFLPSVIETERLQLLRDRYIVLVRSHHPLTRRRGARAVGLADLDRLDYVAVRSHSDTLRILQMLRLEHRVRLTASHFLALPAIVRETDLAVVMPRNIAQGFAADGGYTIIEPRLPLRNFTVALHWSKRFAAAASHRWMREELAGLFREPG